MRKETEPELLTSIKNGIQKIVFNRPKKNNAINVAMYSKLQLLLTEASNNKDVRMVVFTGTGKFYSSGNDLLGSTDGSGKDPMEAFKEFVDSLILFPKLLVAIVNGPAIGVAVTMLPHCDIVYASEEAYFHTPFAKLGLVAEACSTYTFPKILGKSKAGDMLYLGHKMSAIEAKEFGLISDVYKPDGFDKLWRYLNTVSTLSLESILATKRLVQKWENEKLLQINIEEARELMNCMMSSEFQERIVQFMSRKSKL